MAYVNKLEGIRENLLRLWLLKFLDEKLGALSLSLSLSLSRCGVLRKLGFWGRAFKPCDFRTFGLKF